MNLNIFIISIVAAVGLAIVVTALIARGKRLKAQKAADATIGDLNIRLEEGRSALSALDAQLKGTEATLEATKSGVLQQLTAKDEIISHLKENYEKSLNELKENHKETLKAQADALKAELTAQTEKLLEQREKALTDKAKETFETISGGLDKDIKEMKEAFEANKKTHTETSAALKENFENAVRQLENQSRSIGDKADHLAEAMRGNKKYQGIWGETLLLNILTGEGLVEGRDFDKEATLRDELGFVIENEDSSKRMRPDFILHFADNQDVVVDSKVSLAAYSDYLEATTEEARAEARKRNAEAIRNQFKNLSGKDYSKYLKPGHRMTDFVIMFVPNYPALQLAFEQDPSIWREAYKMKVLVTSEETLLPFLRMIELGWRNVEQIRNQQKIIDAASTMVDRVAEFSKHYAEVGKCLKNAQSAYEEGDKKFRDKGKSILVSAKQIKELGVPSKKELPGTYDSIAIEDIEAVEE
ncbi:MAG: DNA recombination protein RmuC [Bacteroidales bacterium]|nr:DNA recombination protein RmuC [Bacteroidales bacterium]